jgi:hypothetical protein
MWALWANGVPSVYLAQLGYQRVFAGEIFPVVTISPVSIDGSALDGDESNFCVWTGVANLALSLSILANTWFGYRYCRARTINHGLHWIGQHSSAAHRRYIAGISLASWGGWLSIAASAGLTLTDRCDSELTDARSNILYTWGWGLGAGASFYLCFVWIWVKWGLHLSAEHLETGSLTLVQHEDWQTHALQDLRAQLVTQTSRAASDWSIMHPVRILNTTILGVAVLNMFMTCSDPSPLHLGFKAAIFVLLAVSTVAPTATTSWWRLAAGSSALPLTPV